MTPLAYPLGVRPRQHAGHVSRTETLVNAGNLDWTDGNANNVWDVGEGEQWTLTGSDGTYVFTDVAPGIYTVAEELKTGWQQSSIPGPPPKGRSSTFWCLSVVSSRMFHS